MTRRAMLALLLTVVTVASTPAQLFLFGAPKGRETCFQSGGTTIRAEVFDAVCDGPAPLLLILHGSDGVTKYASSYRMAAGQLAQAGYNAVIIKYFDKTCTQPDAPGIGMNETEFVAWVQVVKDAISSFGSLPCIDGRRVGVVGFSLGAYLAVAASTADPRIDAVVEMSGGVADKVAAKAKRLAPTLILHGECDTIVPPSEACKLADLAKRLGAPHRLMIYPGQAHILQGGAAKDAAQEALLFFERFL